MNTNLLHQLLAVDSPSGDEFVIADFLADWISSTLPDASPIEVVRLRDCLVAVKRETPKVCLFAHIDTTGWTVGHDGALIPIGSPDGKIGDSVRIVGDLSGATGTLNCSGDDAWSVSGLAPVPGSRIVYAGAVVQSHDWIKAPYLDNRAGVWAALQALQECNRIAVAFTTGEETSTSGATICARYVYEKLGIEQAIVCDITWDTESIHCGSGVAISRRDTTVPSQRYVDRLIGIAEESGIRFQIEIESDGGSDGVGIERSGCPIDWAFVGAPEKSPHRASEELALSDLEGMAAMLACMVDRLTIGVE